jgi:DNA (cytosine-5)-methyltransferase 1
MPLTFGSLFAGIGGFDLGFERAGMVCKWQVEIDPYCQRVLAKHWPNVRRHDDVRTWPQSDTERVDVICGGFPCQDISNAGKRAGIDGDRSGLWFDYARIVRHLRPRIVVVENVSALLIRGIDRVLGDLAACGYDAEWECVPASILGAPHRRDRVFVVAYDASVDDSRRNQGNGTAEAGRNEDRGLVFSEVPERRWDTEPDLDRVVGRFPRGVDRLRCLGNCVVPRVAEWVGGRIVGAYASETT